MLAEKRFPGAPDVPTIDEAGVPGSALPVLVCTLGAQGHAEADRRQTQRRGGGGVRRSGRAEALQRRRHGRLRRASMQNAGGAVRAAQGRDRQMVADDQRRRRQAAIAAWPVLLTVSSRALGPSLVARHSPLPACGERSAPPISGAPGEGALPHLERSELLQRPLTPTLSPHAGRGRAGAVLLEMATSYGIVNTISWSVTPPEPGFSDPAAR